MADSAEQRDDAGTYDVFISYAHRDEREFGMAAELAAALKSAGLSVWYDKELMDDAGEDWHTAIGMKMDAALVIVALWSKTALTRPMCVFEGKRAAEKPEKLIPFELGPIGKEDFTEELYGLTYRINRVPYSLDAALPQIKAKVDAQRSAEARKALADKLAPLPPDAALLAQARVDLPAVLTSGSGFLAGRDAEETLLLEAWASCAPGADAAKKTNIVVLHAIGGAGKTALLRRLVDRLAEQDFPHADKVLGWSAYSQGSGENRNADSNAFIINALRFMGAVGELPQSEIDRARLLATKLKQTRTLLILDGIEPLQHLPDVGKGLLKDKGLQRLIQDLALEHKGLVVITSRQHLPELEKRVRPGVISHALDKLDAKAGAHLLRHLGCWGKASDMEQAAREAQGHALSITLLGSYIDAVEGGDIARRDHLKLTDIVDTPEELQASDQTARLAKRAGAVMRGYIARFEELEKASKGRGEAERLLLSIVGLFDRPGDGGAVRALLEEPAIPGLTDAFLAKSPQHRGQLLSIAKSRLRELKLLAAEDEKDPDALDAHPVVRAHFGKALKQRAPEAYRAAHERLYRMYAAAAPQRPNSLKAMQPLFHAIGHACAAGLHQEVWHEVYWLRVRHGNESFLNTQLGAYAADLGALANFFDPPWSTPAAGLTNPGSQSAALGYAAYCLRALGRLPEAEAPMEAALAQRLQYQDWKNANITAENLTELRLAIGKIASAIESGHIAIEIADRANDDFDMLTTRTTLANVLHAAGQLEAAEALYADAERRQANLEPELPRLYSLRGYEYCDLALARGKAVEAHSRAAYALQAVLHGSRNLLDIAFATLAGARALALLGTHGDTAALAAAPARLDAAVEALRNAGGDDDLPRGLLARAGFRRWRGDFAAAAADLTEADEIATRGSMRLFLADIALERARLCLAQIPGAPAETLVPLDPPRSGSATTPRRNGGNLLLWIFGERPPSRARAPAPAAVVVVAPRTAPLTAEEQALRADAEAHFASAAALIAETGYHRRDGELADLRRRLDALE